MAYNGGIDLIAGIRPKNNGNFPLVHAKDVYVDDELRLDAVLSNLSEKIVTPEMYGAVGDGTTDDSTALQAALNSGNPVVLTKDLYLFTPIAVENKDVFIDGRGYTLHIDDSKNLLTNDSNSSSTNDSNSSSTDKVSYFITIRCSNEFNQEEQRNCEMRMVWDPAEIKVANNDTYHKGYISYRGNNPTPDCEVYHNLSENDENKKVKIFYWHAHSVTVKNINCECQKVSKTLIFSFDGMCHGLLQNLRVYTVKGQDGGAGINVYRGYDFNITNCFVSGFAGLGNNTPEIYHSIGYGLQASGTNITISDCVFRNCRAELSIGASRSYFDCNVIVNNIILERDPGYVDNENIFHNYTHDRLFDIHAAIHNPLISNVTINNNTALTIGFYAILWRCPRVYAQNIYINSNANMTGIFFGELAEEITINGLYAAKCDIRTDGAPNLKTLEINTGIVRRLIACNSTNALVRMRNVTIREIAHDIRNGWFENCRFRHDISWSAPTIIATASLTLIDCEIEGEHTYWYKSTPLIKAPQDSVTMKNCKIYTMPNNERKLFNTHQTDVSGNYEEDIAGIRLGTDRAILGENNLF